MYIEVKVFILTYSELDTYERGYNSKSFQEALDHENAMTGERTSFSQYVIIKQRKANAMKKAEKIATSSIWTKWFYKIFL